MAEQSQKWDDEYASGRWDFLDNKDQQMRHAVTAAMIATYGPGRVVDLGCGPAHLLDWLRPGSVSHYTGVDVSQVAMQRMPEVSFPVEKVVTSLEIFNPGAVEIGTLVASEVLYFLDDAGAALAGIETSGIRCIATCETSTPV